MIRLNAMRLLLGVICALMLAACASMGRPEGGPRDELPPVFVSSNPAPGSLNVNRNRITLTFDENVQLTEASSKVVISPVQKQMPSISAGGRHINVELRDTMLPNTTYTIDFADAIKDLNEGNVLDGLAIDFSTGDSIDTLCISGMVLEARNLEPAQGMLVGIYSNLSDTAITSLQLERIAKTNQLGQFTVRNLKPGQYQIFALNDVNRDYRWDRTEDVAFYDVAVSPATETIEVTDTFAASDGSDSLAVRSMVRYLPDDILLTWFNEGYASQYLRDNSRKDRRIIHLEFGAKSDTLPDIRLINGPRPDMPVDDWARLEHSATLDTLSYWITDTALVSQDTLLLQARYLRTDTLQQLSWATDTLRLIHREAKSRKKNKEKKKELSDSDSIAAPELTFLTFQAKTGSSQDVHRPLVFEASQPLDTILPEAIAFAVQVNDTVWDTLAVPPIMRDPGGAIRRYTMEYDWTPGAKYRLTIDSAAIVGVYHEWNKPFKHEFSVKPLEDYSSVRFDISGLPDSLPAMAELLASGDKPVAVVPVEGGSAWFRYIQPGTYYARLYVDRNGNGEWDTGSISERLQPEEVYYYPKKLNLRKNWDVDQAWDINELPIDRQKPDDIKKNKPKTRDRQGMAPEEYEEEEYDDWNENPFDPNSRRNDSSRRNSTGVSSGGFRTNATRY